MDKLAFAPMIDLPLAVATVIGFLLHFNAWSRGESADTSIDLGSRLPAARIRVVVFFLAVLFVCWMVNFAFWAVLAALVAIGIVFSTLAGGDSSGAELFVFFAAYVIREWAFGFPQLILGPPSDRHVTPRDALPDSELIGRRGVALSPLRPSGDADVEGSVVSVVSDDGRLIDAGMDVVVSGTRNGRVCVRPLADPPQDGSEQSGAREDSKKRLS